MRRSTRQTLSDVRTRRSQARAKETERQAKERAYIATLPKLQSGSSEALMATSIDCARDYNLGGHLKTGHRGSPHLRGPKMRLHDLRHSAVAILLAQGVNIKAISELLGHSSVAFTLQVYGHLLEGVKTETAAKMNAALSGVVAKPDVSMVN
jgi:integrase